MYIYIHTYTYREREREAWRRGIETERQMGMKQVHPKVSSSLKSFLPLDGSLENVSYHPYITYLSLRMSPK